MSTTPQTIRIVGAKMPDGSIRGSVQLQINLGNNNWYPIAVHDDVESARADWDSLVAWVTHTLNISMDSIEQKER